MTIRLTQLFGLIGGALMALAALLAAAWPAAAETPSEKAAALLHGLIKTNDPGLAVLVAQNGKILFEKSYGLADREDHVPVIPQTTFRIGSMTKQFTASAILKLQEEGKLSVNDKLSKYIPDFPRGDEVTLRHLLTHTSGIRDYTDEPHSVIFVFIVSLILFWRGRNRLPLNGETRPLISDWRYRTNKGDRRTANSGNIQPDWKNCRYSYSFFQFSGTSPASRDALVWVSSLSGRLFTRNTDTECVPAGRRLPI
ncbi:MAG: serine hydrolase domain-containing protein [Verrucomicrobiota bacterium]